MTDNSEDFPRLSHQRLLEIRTQLWWIRELLQVMLFLVVVWVLRSEHVSWIISLVSFVVLMSVLEILSFLKSKYEH
jgi:hypothetical protein